MNPGAKRWEIKDPKNLNFTLERKLPLTMTTKKENISYTPPDFPISILDKGTYNKNEEALVINKLLHRNSHKIVTIDTMHDSKSMKATTFLMRNYNEGRHGGWNNQATLVGGGMPSYIYQTKKFLASKASEEADKERRGIQNPRLLTSVGNKGADADL